MHLLCEGDLVKHPGARITRKKPFNRKHGTRLKRIYSFTDEQIYFQNDNRNFLTSGIQSF